MNIALFTKCDQCWSSRNTIMGSCSHQFDPRIQWNTIRDCITIVRVTYRFIAEMHQKDYLVTGNSFSLLNLFPIIGSITGVQLIFRYINPFLMIQKDSSPIYLSNEQVYNIRDYLGSKSYLYGENSAF